jgi:hypothetical protein
MKGSLVLLVLTLILGSCSKSLSKKEIDNYTIRGNEISLATQKTLGNDLMQKMKSGGVKEALPYCNTMAYPLTDQMSEKYEASIKRASHKLRNSLNKATPEEEKIINQFKSALLVKSQINPIVKLDNDGNPHYYSPIIMQKKCLACHGTVGKEVTKSTDSLIKSLYPNDDALGFVEGELRGIWSITFKF